MDFFFSPRILGIIPARLNSTRLPSKLLKRIHGKSIIQMTYENARSCHSLSEVFVATDSSLIYDEVLTFGGHAVMTSEHCQTGTDRIIEAYNNLSQKNPEDIVINIQGDEPVLDVSIIDSIVKILRDDPTCMVATAATSIKTPEEAQDKSVVKCVLSKNGSALYFSRALLPCGKSGQFSLTNNYYKHLGVYAFKAHFLPILQTLPATPLQLAEDLEQLKILEHGYSIKVAITEAVTIGIDTINDLIKLEKLLCMQNLSLSQAESAPR